MSLYNTDYEAVAASQSTVVLGPNTATINKGDLLEHILVIPATTAPGAISIKDGSDSAITVFTGGTDSVTSLTPFSIFLGARSRTGSWQLTTGANVSCIAVGKFT